MIFLDHPSAIYPHINKQFTTEISRSSSGKFYLTLSPTSFGIWNSIDLPNPLITQYELPNELNGIFTQSTWSSDSTFFILTNFGFIYNFVLSTKIILKRIIHPPKGTLVTTISIWNSNLICGTEDGDILIYNPKFQFKKYHLIDFPIKRICVNQSHCVLLSLDGKCYKFDVHLSLFDLRKEFQFNLQQIETNYAMSITISKTDSHIAILCREGIIFITDLTQTWTIKTNNKNSFFSIDWSDDGQTLYIIFNDGTCYMWTYITQSSRYFKTDEFYSTNSITIIKNNYLILSINKGICKVPIYNILHCSSPILYNIDTIIEFRATENSAVPIYYHLSTYYKNKIQQIKYISSDEKNRFFAISGNKNIVLISRTSGKWLCPKQPKDLNICGLSWIDTILCVVNEISLRKFELIFYNVLNFQPIQKFNIPSKPILIKSDLISCVLAFENQIQIFSILSKTPTTFPLKIKPFLVDVHSLSNQVIVLLSNRDLMVYNITNKTAATVYSNVSNFLIDHNFGLLFIITGLKVYISSLSNIKFSLFIETNETILGAFPNCSSLMSLKSNSLPPFIPKVNQFFDLSIVEEMKTPHKAANILKSMQNSPIFQNLLRQICIFSLRKNMGEECLIFLYHFPKEMNQILCSTLRAVESKERQKVFELLGLPSNIFMDIAKLSMNLSKDIIEFNQRKETTKNEISNASILLPVIMEEEGPEIAFPASLFILEKMYNDLDVVESLMRFMDPLLTNNIMRNENGLIDCDGMLLNEKFYVEIRKKLFEVIEKCLLNLMILFLPNVAFEFANIAQLKLSEVLVKYEEIDKNLSLIKILDNLAPLYNSGKISKNDCKIIAVETYNGNWLTYSVALMLIGGELDQAWKIMDNRNELKTQFRGSQWQYLFDT